MPTESISWVLSVTSILVMWLLGNKKNWAWLLGAANQFIWFPYSWVTEQHGFLPLSVIFFIVYVRNYWKGRKS